MRTFESQRDFGTNNNPNADQSNLPNTENWRPPSIPAHGRKFQISDYVALKLRGLPFQIKASDIAFFFSDYEYVPNSVFLGKN